MVTGTHYMVLFHIQVLFPGTAKILSAERSFTQLLSGVENLDLGPINKQQEIYNTAGCLETAFYILTRSVLRP